MRLQAKLTIVLLLLLGLASCEKHDGILYYKWKCVADINGHSYIDQSPAGFNPGVTPILTVDSLSVHFETLLRDGRRGAPAYYVEIFVNCDTPEAYLTADQHIERPEEKDREWYEYTEYCKERNISWARVNHEIVQNGTFRLSRDKHGNNKGTFSLSFSEGTLEGRFGY